MIHLVGNVHYVVSPSDSVIFTGTINACRKRAQELNRLYKTDRYEVE